MLDIPCMVGVIFICNAIHNLVHLRKYTDNDDEFHEEENIQPPYLEVGFFFVFQTRDLFVISILLIAFNIGLGFGYSVPLCDHRSLH